MYKRMSLLTAKEGLPRKAFLSHWYGVHGPMIAALDGLRAYVQNGVEDERHRPGQDGTVFRADGIVELYFDCIEDMHAAFAGAGNVRIEVDEDNFLGTSSGFSIAEDLVPPSSPSTDKVIITLGEGADFAEAERALGRFGRVEVNRVQTRFGAKAGALGLQKVAAFLHLSADRLDIAELFDAIDAPAVSLFKVAENRLK